MAASQRLIARLVDLTGVTATASAAPQDTAMLRDFVYELRVTETVSGTTLDVVVEDSFDDGVTWNPWVTFTQLSTTGDEVLTTARHPGGLVRATYTVVGGTWSIRVLGSANPLR